MFMGERDERVVSKFAMQNLIRTGSIDLISDVHRSNEIFFIDVLINSSIRAFHRLQRSQEFFEFP